MNWDGLTRLKNDRCAEMVHDKESSLAGSMGYTAPGYYWCQSQKEYAAHLTEPVHFQKQYRNGCNISVDSELRYAPLTDPNLINQLWARPYRGCFMGAGQRALNENELETELLTGIDTRGSVRTACDVLADVNIDRFEQLHEYGNPQRVKHIIPTWTWGGEDTRDYVRQINYNKHCKNKK
jgi:hypothetical protein